jgi:tRNA(Phe) wybutosine-synthesizing methylase Tyw3
MHFDSNIITFSSCVGEVQSLDNHMDWKKKKEKKEEKNYT